MEMLARLTVPGTIALAASGTSEAAAIAIGRAAATGAPMAATDTQRSSVRRRRAAVTRQSYREQLSRRHVSEVMHPVSGGLGHHAPSSRGGRVDPMSARRAVTSLALLVCASLVSTGASPLATAAPAGGSNATNRDVDAAVAFR